MQDTNKPTREVRIRDMRAILDFYEAHPELKLPYELGSSDYTRVYCLDDKEQFNAHARALGSFEKQQDDDGNDFLLVKYFGNRRLEVQVDRVAVCERIVVGTEEVPETVIPAQEEKVIPAHTRERYEWKCPSVLADLEPEADTVV